MFDVQQRLNSVEENVCLLVFVLSKTVMELCFAIDGQTAIVTGASSGLGVTFAETLAERGVNLLIAARRYDKLVKVAEALAKKHGVKVVSLQTDVSREDQVVKMVETAVNKVWIFGDLGQQCWYCLLESVR